MASLPDIESLLSESDWARRLARRLVGDPHLADDLVQDAWVAALQASGPPPSSPRAWLGGVLRNLTSHRFRGEAHRRQREESTARPEAEPSTDEVVAELSLQRQVMDLLLELEEPWRTTLHLRFQRDLSLKEIARRQGVAPSTVHERVERGLGELRRRLDGEYGERCAWVSVFLPFSAGGSARGASPGAGVPATLAGGLAVSSTLKILLVSTLVTGGLAGALWLRDDPRPGPASPLAASPVERSAELAGAVLAEQAAPGPGSTRRETAASTAPPVEPASAVAEPPAALAPFRGRVQTMDGSLLAGMEVGTLVGSETEWRTTTDARGRFEIPGDVDLERHHGLVAGDPTFTTLVPGVPSREEEAVVVVAPRRTLEGRVVNPEGEPLAGAKVAVRLRHELFRELQLRRPVAMDLDGRTTLTDDAGRFTLTEAVAGPNVFLESELVGHDSGRADTEPAAGPLEIVLTPHDFGNEVVGTVLDPSGRPVDDARVSLGTGIVRTREGGRFRLAVRDSYFVNPRFEPESTTLRAVAPGFRPATAEIDPGLAHQDVVLQLGPEPLEIHGRVVNEAGEPVPGALVWLADPSPLGHQRQTQGDYGVLFPITVEEVITDQMRRLGAVCDAEGRFALKGLVERDYLVKSCDPATLAVGEDREIPAGARDVELALAADASLQPVAGRVWSPSLGPLAGVKVTPDRAWATEDGRVLQNSYLSPPMSLASVATVTTDDEGRFAFPGLSTGSTYLELEGERVPMARRISLADRSDPADLDIEVRVLCDFQVDFADRPELADRLRVLDEEGESLRIHESFGMFLAFTETSEIEDGQTGVLQVTEGARTFVLEKDGEEVTRLSVELEPGELRTIHP